jgi:hypothetical protein
MTYIPGYTEVISKIFRKEANVNIGRIAYYSYEKNVSGISQIYATIIDGIRH